MQVDGVEDLLKLAGQIESSTDRIGRKGSAILRRAALDIEATGKRLAPVDTGFLRSSITHTFTGDGRSTSMSAEVGPEASYGGFVEYGTHRQAPQPYMTPAAVQVEPKFLAALAALDPLDGEA